MDNTRRITSLLDELSEIIIFEEEKEKRDEILSAFKLYYKVHKRHKYTEIAEYVLNTLESERESEKIDVVTSNLDLMCEYLKGMIPCIDNQNSQECKKSTGIYACADEKGNCAELIGLYNSLNKLNDHTHLESLRWSKILKDTETHSEFIKRIDQKQQKLNDKQQEVTAELNAANDKTEKVYLQIVSILGIFTAIVFGVFGGVKAIETIGAVLAQSEICAGYIIIAAALVTLFVIWVIYVLFNCIYWLQEKKLNRIGLIIPMIVMTVLCVVAIVVSLIFLC